LVNRVSTGNSSLDQVIDDLRLGDNVVWQIEEIADYRRFVTPYVRQALADQRKICYIRFAAHESLIEPEFSGQPIMVHQLDGCIGFESFTSQLYQVITDNGREAFYIFDCLSDLLDQWSSDLMIGNFFKIICPFLFELDTVAYFALRRNAHSFDTFDRIRETTQLLIDLFHQEQHDYIHLQKVWQRYSPTMFLPHRLEGDQFIPVTSSADTTSLFIGRKTHYYPAAREIDYWDRLFIDAENALPEAEKVFFERLCPLLIGEESKISRLVREYLKLSDLIQIKRRQIGTGKIGGKAVGMLLARKILAVKSPDFPIMQKIELEQHDSFYLGTDLYYTYIVHNGWWKLLMEQKTSDGYFDKARILHENLLNGQFPAIIREKFRQILEYFGQSPYIVRSSSLLEDNFGNAFAGKYESIFCVNQGSLEERYCAFEKAVRCVYASTMDESALNYRLKRGMSQRDEQMALLVQRVSGTYHGRYFYPLLAGVGHSDNLYVWNKLLDPKVGILRMVYGLGTRAVDRVEGDYPRIIALDHPLMSTHDSREAEITYSQHYIDLLDLEANQHTTLHIDELIAKDKTVEIEEVGEVDWEATRNLASMGLTGRKQWIINFRKILSENSFTETMRTLMEILEAAYEYPVDIEFTINRTSQKALMINVLQCRPFQTKQIGPSIEFPNNIDIKNVLIQSKGHFMGGNVNLLFKYMIYVIPEKYAQLKEQERYQVARIIGQLNHLIADPETAPTILLGPGRWGTTTPSLGIPVRFSEINNIIALGEIAFETAGMMPEISFGTHFFQDLVETNIFYLAILPRHGNNLFNTSLIMDSPNLLEQFLPQLREWESIIRVCDFSEDRLTLLSDITTQKLICFKASAMLGKTSNEPDFARK
jgi:hypothetical protein